LGLLDIFKRQDKSKSEAEQSVIPTDFKTQLDIVEKDIYAKLKPVGFKKNGRTFNRRLDDGIIHKEYDCQIRDRLGTLLTGQDYWWTITDDNNKITQEIILKRLPYIL